MQIKKRNIMRILFVIIFVLIISAILIKYGSYERRILLFEMIRELGFFYLLVVELPLAILRNHKKVNSFWKKGLLFLLAVFSITSIFLVGMSTYHLVCDVFNGYQEKELIVIKRHQQYRASDKVWVKVDNKIQTFYIAPGYVEVDEGDAYKVRIFNNSQIMIPVNKTN